MTVINAEMIEFLQDRLDFDEDEAMQFAQELEDNGIETEEQFDESYQGYFSSYYAEKEFAEHYFDEKIDVTNPLYNYIDWQSVWDRELRYDFFEIDGHFFRNI